jgi:hypothetical protein
MDLAALFPGCDPAGTPEELQACIDQIIECEACHFARRIDGLARHCDEFDDGVVNFSCRIGYRSKPFDVRPFCVGGENDGESCAGHTDCPDGVCTPLANFLITTSWAPLGIGPFPLAGHTSTDCGVVDPNTGVATCQCMLENVEPVYLQGVGFVCFETIPDCPSGKIDCDGGTPMEIDMISNHDVGETLQGPNLLDYSGPGSDYCDMFNPALANQQCDAACEVYCAGANPPAHANQCQCQCVQIGGNDSGPGGMYCQTGVEIVVETDEPCDGTDITSTVGERCSLVSTERARSVILNADGQIGSTIDAVVQTGIRPDCYQLARGEAVISTVGHRIFLDSDQGDQDSATTSMTGTQ